MVRRVASISLPPDLYPFVEQFQADGGNFSGLVCRLLRAHFTGGSDPKTVAVIGAEFAGRLTSSQGEIEQLTADMAQFQTKAAEAQENEAAEAEKRAEDLDEAIRASYHEMDEGGLDGWRRIAGGEARLAQYAKVRASTLAERFGVDPSEVRRAVLRVYPALEGYV